jgi:hypothetical protein
MRLPGNLIVGADAEKPLAVRFGDSAHQQAPGAQHRRAHNTSGMVASCHIP